VRSERGSTASVSAATAEAQMRARSHTRELIDSPMGDMEPQQAEIVVLFS